MRKSRILGCALTLAATLVVGGAMGQKIPTTKGFTKVGATDGDEFNKRSFVTKDKTYGFFIEPDALFNPDFAANGNVFSTWIWDLSAAAGVTASATTTATNYVTLTAATLGDQTIKVQEKAKDVFGGCVGSAKEFKLLVLPEPTFSFTAADGVAITDKAACGDNDKKTITINISALDKVHAKFTLTPYNVTINALDGKLTETAGTATNYNLSVNAGGKVTDADGIEWSLTGTALTDGASYDKVTGNQSMTLTCTKDFKAPLSTDNFPIKLYKFTVKDDGTEGANDFVSRKGDFNQLTGDFGTEKYYLGTGAVKEVLIYVKKAPKTGPVYHIANNHSK